MNNKDKNFEQLQKHWNFLLQQGYNENHILGIWTYGSQNYEHTNEDNNVNIKAIILPTFEQFCLNPQMIPIEYHIDETHIEVKDIRSMRNMWMQQHIDFINILYGNNFIINAEYKELFDKYFIQNREAIAHYDKQAFLKNTSKLILQSIKDKNLNKANKLYIFLKDYFNEKSYAECLKNAETALKDASELEQLTNELVDKYAEVQSPRHDEAAAALNEGVIEILKRSFQEEISTPIISKKEFFDNLTAIEIKAYYAIVSQIHDKGNIIISDMVTKTAISRPVYTNLLLKLKQYGVAKVTNRGSKGTDIEITQIEMKNEAIDFILK